MNCQRCDSPIKTPHNSENRCAASWLAGYCSPACEHEQAREIVRAGRAWWQQLAVPGWIAVDSDWPADGVGGCQGRSFVGGKCTIQYKHTGEPHRFCNRQPHDGYCTDACFTQGDK